MCVWPVHIGDFYCDALVSGSRRCVGECNVGVQYHGYRHRPRAHSDLCCGVTERFWCSMISHYHPIPHLFNDLAGRMGVPSMRG